MPLRLPLRLATFELTKILSRIGWLILHGNALGTCRKKLLEKSTYDYDQCGGSKRK